MSIAAVIVNHNAGPALTACVESLLAATVDEVIVVDNQSSDNSLDLLARIYPEVTLIETGANLGYGSAINIGRRKTELDYLFICNPDLLVDERAPGYLASYLVSHPEVAVVGPRILEPTGEVYPSARNFPSVINAIGHGLLAMFWPTNRFSRRYKPPTLDLNNPSEAGWVSGACMMARVSAYDQVGGFDERYFMYVEDLDLCWRLTNAGWKIAYQPLGQVVHQGGLSSSRHPYKMQVAHHRSTWRFARRSLTGPKAVLLPVVGVGLVARLFISLCRERFVHQSSPTT